MSTRFKHFPSTRYEGDVWRRAGDTWKEIESLCRQNDRYRYFHERVTPFEVRDDLDRLKDGTYLRGVVDRFRDKTLENSVQRNMSSYSSVITEGDPDPNEVQQCVDINIDGVVTLLQHSTNPATGRQWTKDEAVKEAVVSITAGVGDRLVDKAVDHSTTYREDMPFNRTIVPTAITETIIDFMELQATPKTLEDGRQGWDQRCKHHTVAEIEAALPACIGGQTRYRPNCQTHDRHFSTLNLSLPPSRVQHMIDVRTKRANDAMTRLERAVAVAPDRFPGLPDMDFNKANKEILSRVGSYMVRDKFMDIAQVVNSQRHLSEDEWRQHGDVFGAFYRKTLTNGEKTLENFLNDSKQGFVSMDYPPQLSFWVSKGDPSANSQKITIPDANTFEETAKSVGMFRARHEPLEVWEGMSDQGL